MSIITNRELRDLWADAAKIKEAISGGKVAVADAAVLAELEAMRVLLAGTLSTADAAVLAKLADLESKLDMILNGTTPAAVQLTGRKVEQALARQVRGAGVHNALMDAPEFAKSAFILVRVYGATGTFDSGEGLEFWTRLSNTPYINLLRLESTKVTSASRHIHMWGVGGDLGDIVRDTAIAGGYKYTSIPPQRQIEVRLDITGTFAAGEGFDCVADVIWLP